MTPTIDRKVMLDRLRRNAEELGHSPTRDEMRVLSRADRGYSTSAYEKKFGSLNNARREAGLETVENTIRLQPKRSVTSKKVPPSLRFQTFARDKFACTYCGASAKSGAVLVVDHITPRARGGTTEAHNLVTACWDCNAGKTDMLLSMEHMLIR